MFLLAIEYFGTARVLTSIILTSLIISSIFLIHSSFRVVGGLPMEDDEKYIPGEPLNPDDFEAGKIYLQNVRAGIINEPPDDPSKELYSKNADMKGLTWPGGVVSYTLSDNFQIDERAVISSAMSEYQPRTCITFAPRRGESDYINIVRGNKNAGCFSMIGRRGGPQTLQVGPDCMRRGSIIHEFLHAIGFAHEHQRKDRDEYVEINYEYILEQLRNQFHIIDNTHNTIGAYDYDSILHYSARANCIDPCPADVKTINPKKNPNANLGQRNGLSSLDIERINALYNCTRPLVSNEPSNQASNSVMNWIPIIGKPKVSSKCEDLDDRCRLLSDHDCRQNSTWVNFSCRQTCRNCDNKCKDFNAKCSQWSGQNMCTEYPEYMLTYCQRSCGLCSSKRKE